MKEQKKQKGLYHALKYIKLQNKNKKSCKYKYYPTKQHMNTKTNNNIKRKKEEIISHPT